MLNRNFRNGATLIALFVSLSVFAAGDVQPDPSRFQSSFSLDSFAGKMTFLQVMNSKIKPALDQIYRTKGRADNVAAVMRGQGVALELHKGYWNFHVNYADGAGKNPNVKDEMTGRSYGMGPSGHASDPSDAFYLDELEEVVHKASPKDLGLFYQSIIHMIGDCDSRGFDFIQPEPIKAVLTDFMAVYGAEEDRHLMSIVKTGSLGSFNWDDAIWEVTMVASVHGGQKQLTRFYEVGVDHADTSKEILPVFTDKVFDQHYKAYKQPEKRPRGTPARAAKLRDYWQFGTSVNARGEQNRSGINVTRRDFEAMGKEITQFETNGPGKQLIVAIENIVHGRGENVFKDITSFYINQRAINDVDPQGRSLTRDSTKALAGLVANLLVQVRADGEKITDAAMMRFAQK